MTNFAPLDLSLLPAPDALENLVYEAVLDARMQDYLARWTAARVIDPTLPVYNVDALETDPAKILQETDAYRELIVRARVNDAVLATSLAKATGHDLDIRAADFHTVRVAGETDDSLRRRAQLAWENLSLGGSYGGYRYAALSAAPVELADVAVYGAEVAGVAPGEVRIVCLGANADGVVHADVLKRVKAAFPRAQRKVNDHINVVSAIPVQYNVTATIILRRGADAASVTAAQNLRLDAYTLSRRVIAAAATLGGITAALGHDDPGYVVDVQISSPTTRIGGDPFEAPVCVGSLVTWAFET